jgi:hypothetical protein
MEGTPEEKVLAYIETHDHKPLVLSTKWYDAWGTGETKMIPPVVPFEINDVKTMVDWAIMETKYRSTHYLIGGKQQCSLYRRRSSFDIWRVIRYYNPDIDLFSVMRYMISMRNINRSYCSVVRKRVFCWNGNAQGSFYDTTLDEYGLYPNQWEHIGESSA